MNNTEAAFNKFQAALFYILWGLVFLCLLFVARNSDGTYDTGDGVTHYFISRFSFKHPYLFLDLWGKPFFTLVSSPFAQFGLHGITVFNILCGMLASLCAFQIACALQLKHSWLVLFFCIFSPIYIAVLNSGLTEPFFSLILIFSILLVFKKRAAWSALVLSLGPFVRPEANFLLPVFALYFILAKQYKAIPLLLAGTLLYSIGGYFFTHDIFWLKTQSPYSEANSTKYGTVHGEFLNYIGNYDQIIGLPLALLFICGCFFFILLPILQKKMPAETASLFFKEELLVYACVFATIAVHTIVWWKGIFPTLGLNRYMSCIIPLTSILCLRGLNLFFLFIRNFYLQCTIAVLLAFWICTFPFKIYAIPFGLDQEQTVVKKGTDWIKNSEYKGKTTYATHPCSVLMLDLDPYDGASAPNPSAIHADAPGNGITPGSIIVWDAHYGAVDNHLPAKCLLESTDYKLLKKFEPDSPFNVFGDIPFEVYIFQRI